jgi:hypothetical protein
LLDHVTAFTSWWSTIVTLLITLKSGVAQLHSSKLEKSRMALIQERWADIANQYRSYAREVSEDTEAIAGFTSSYPPLTADKQATRLLPQLSTR